MYKLTEVTANDGTRLAMHAWVPEKTEAVLFYIPGMQSHGLWLEETGAFMSNQAIALYALDRRGVGLSAGMPGDIPSVDILLTDYIAALRYVQDQHQHIPVTLLGQSLGGSVLAALLLHPELDVSYQNLIFCAAGLGKRHGDLSPGDYIAQLHDISDELLPVNLPISDMTELPEYQRFIAEDDMKLTHMTKRGRAVLLQLENKYWEKTNIIQDYPVALVLPEYDPIVNNALTLDTFNRLTNKAGYVMYFPSNKHYLWFTKERYALMSWVAHFILTNGYKEMV